MFTNFCNNPMFFEASSKLFLTIRCEKSVACKMSQKTYKLLGKLFKNKNSNLDDFYKSINEISFLKVKGRETMLGPISSLINPTYKILTNKN